MGKCFQIHDPLKETDETLISISIKGKVIEYGLSDTYLPIATHDQCQNNQQHYYYRFITRFAQWKRIIESELFEIEFKHLWVKE
jgi:hypothetical protein